MLILITKSFFFLIFFSGLYLVSKRVSDYSSHLISFFTLVSIFFIFSSYIIFFYEIKFLIILSTYIIFFVGVYFIANLYVQNNKINFFFIKKNINLIIIIIFYFFLSNVYPSDYDTLRYHLEIPKKIINNSILFYQYLDYLYFSNGEIISLVGLLFNYDNLVSLINFLSLLLLIIFKKDIKNNCNEDFNYLNILFVFTVPFLINLISTQKIFILPILLIVLSNLYILKKQNLSKNEILCLLLINLFAASLKLSFSPFVAINIAIIFWKSKKNFNLFFLFLILFSFLIFLPQAYLKYITYGEPFFPAFLLNKENQELIGFREYLFNYEKNINIKNLLFLIPNFILPLEFSTIVRFIGLSCVTIFFLKKDKFIIFILFFIMVILIGNLQTRWFLICFYYACIASNLKMSNKALTNTANVQYLYTLIITIPFTLTFIFSSKNFFYNNFVPEYKLIKEIEKDNDFTILTSFENYYNMNKYIPLYMFHLKSDYQKKKFKEKNLKAKQKYIIFTEKRLIESFKKEIIGQNSIVIAEKQFYVQKVNKNFLINEKIHICILKFEYYP